MSTTEQRTIAAGGNPPWEYTATHPQHGELTFRGRLPLATDSLRHSIALDNRLQDLEGEPSGKTLILAAALAGMVDELLIELPAIGEPHVEADEESGREVVTRIKYNPETESRLAFLSDVWLDYSAWRAKLLSDETVRAVGKSSGGPDSSSGASSTPSAASTAPPSPTPDS